MSDPENRLAREKAFHDKRFSKPSKRAQRVGKFYKITQSIRNQYWDFLEENMVGAKALEYGCGTGSYSFKLAKNGVAVSAIDISQVALAQAKEQAEKEGISNYIDFYQMNAENLDFPENTFDLICGTGILHHLQLDKAVPEVSRVLKPGGKVAFIEPLGHNFFINLYRTLTPSIRSEDEHPILATDLTIFDEYFEHVQYEYFYLTALIATLPLSGFLLNPLERFDKRLFRYHFWQKQAWQVLIRLTA